MLPKTYNWTVTVNVSADQEVEFDLEGKTETQVMDHIRTIYPTATSAVLVVVF